MIYKLADGYYVRGLQQEDIEGSYPSWFEDQEVCAFNSHGKTFKNKEWFRNFYLNLNAEDQIVWAICHHKDGHIGNVSLQGMSFINRNAEFAILIGEKKHWRKSVGLNAAKILLTHGFCKLNLTRIYCGTAETNFGMQKLALNLGMKEEGRRRKHIYLNGKWLDMLEYGVLREEFVVAESIEK
ncbi:acetyltransferase [Thalassospira lucentensis]|uniref:Protein N-acetyltransferase, RimJ/RimL family n=2 Tax=Thalassospira TaxID=168934 RepID=A0A285T761_9PROT|nr:MULTISPECIES: GNAT family N-acetyltransferase [Thalassospira]KZB66867.1 acetyltransferase [Thalassospira lucentensis]MCH2273505.1 GNAT family N-acetyltransferase [Thalassospira sp.]SOC16705.1 Protein N-acetyltransferase, RimJ/RimL family [Thalassospira xiamenensis]